MAVTKVHRIKPLRSMNWIEIEDRSSMGTIPPIRLTVFDAEDLEEGEPPTEVVTAFSRDELTEIITALQAIVAEGEE